MIVRESPDELTLRAEEVGTLNVCANVDHMERERWGPPWRITTGVPSCQALYEGIEGEDWEDTYFSYKEMSRAVGVKKPQEAQKAKALWTMKGEAAKDAGEEYYDPTSEESIKGRNETRLALWEEHLKDPIVALDNAQKCVDVRY